MHVTLRMVPALAGLRTRDRHRVIRQALARTSDRDGSRIVHYTIQSTHLHLLAEPETRDAFTRQMIAFQTSCAKRLNRLVERRGRVFADRYHARQLTSPAQVRRALCYVLNNWKRHGERGHWRTDPFSSADLFDGWTCDPGWRRPDAAPVPVATFWLLTKGWRRHGLLDPDEMPGITRA